MVNWLCMSKMSKMLLATHAVIGKSSAGGCGLLSWHDNEFSAWREAFAVRKHGGKASVVEAPEGRLSAEDQMALSMMLLDSWADT